MTSAKQICSPDKIAEEVYVSVVAYAAEVCPHGHFGTKLVRELTCLRPQNARSVLYYSQYIIVSWCCPGNVRLSENYAFGVLVFEVVCLESRRRQHRLRALPATALAELGAFRFYFAPRMMSYLLVFIRLSSSFLVLPVCFSLLPARWTRCGR